MNTSLLERPGIKAGKCIENHWGVLDRYRCHETYPLPCPGPCCVALNWQGRGKLSIEALNDSGYVLHKEVGWRGSLEIAFSPPGTSLVRVTYADFLDDDITYALAVMPY